MNGFINMTAGSARTKVYRVFSYGRLVQMFESRKNVLVRPKLWDDPLENYVLDAAHRMVSAKRGARSRRAQDILDVKERLYGQCWSAASESDAMWRIYSADKTGVSVKTSISKLLSSITSSPEAEGSDCYVGKVRYIDGRSLFSKLSDSRWLKSETRDSKGQAASLLFKRDAFKHEREVRLVMLNEGLADQDKFFYSIDPHKIIEEVVLDPRMSKELASVFADHLQRKLKFKRKITQSSLYRIPRMEPWRAA